MEMSEVIADRVNKDLDNDIIAVWHDESHMNRYMIDNPPTLELSPEYCYPEPELGRHSQFDPKIIALLKITMKLDLREIPAVYINLEQHKEKNENMQKFLNNVGLNISFE